jgi:hypothetical protein
MNWIMDNFWLYMAILLAVGAGCFVVVPLVIILLVVTLSRKKGDPGGP